MAVPEKIMLHSADQFTLRFKTARRNQEEAEVYNMSNCQKGLLYHKEMHLEWGKVYNLSNCLKGLSYHKEMRQEWRKITVK